MNTAYLNTTVPSSRPFYARVGALGFGLIALAAVVASVTIGDSGQATFFALATSAILLLIGVAVWRFGRWALIPAAVLSLALLVLVGPFSIFTLGHPESGRDFIPILLALSGALLGFVGSAVAIAQWARRNSRTHATRAERGVLGVMLGAVTVVVLISAIMTLTWPASVSAAAKAGAAGVQIKSFAFTPDNLQASAGGTVRIVVKNEDPTLHTLTLPQAGVDVAVPPGTEKMVEFKAPAAGVYQWYCIPHSDVKGSTRTGMVGTLFVK